MKKEMVLLFFLALAVGTLVGSSPAHASGFAIVEASGKGLGEAFAGGKTDTRDASALFYNPAAIAFMDNNSVAAAVSVLDINMEFKNEGSAVSRVFPPPIGGAPLVGGDGGDGGETAVVPVFYCVQGISENITLGLGVSSPFGLATKWNKDWVGRYHAVKSDLLTVDISPSVGIKLTDFLSAGASLNLQYIDAELTNALDFGAINYGLAPDFGGIPPLGPAVIPQSADGFADMQGDDWGMGYSLGLLLQLGSETKIGVSYRSKVDHNLEGDVRFTVPAAAAPLTTYGLFLDSDIKARLTTPESLGIGLEQALGESLVLMADATWTHWNRFRKLTIKFDNPAQPDKVTEEKWTDTMRYSLGMEYFLDQTWTLRAGTAWDESPVKTEYRTPRLPGNDRIWLSLGASCAFSESIRADLGYTHLFIRDGKSRLANDPVAGDLIGKYESSVDIYSAQLSMYF